MSGGKWTERTRRPSASLVISILALFVAIGGGAYAASKVGKNEVVTKSIKNGAVTEAKIDDGAVSGAKIDDGAVSGDKIQDAAISGPKLLARSVDGSKIADGSIDAAKLTPGTIGSGKSIQAAIFNNGPTGVSAVASFSPSGVSSTGDLSFATAPVEMEVADLHVTTLQQGAGQSVQVRLEAGAVGAGTTPVVSCTVAATASACSSSGTGTIPAGNIYVMRLTNGAGGAIGSLISVGYTLKPK